ARRSSISPTEFVSAKLNIIRKKSTGSLLYSEPWSLESRVTKSCQKGRGVRPDIWELEPYDRWPGARYGTVKAERVTARATYGRLRGERSPQSRDLVNIG
ncbi:unnamed protein product, partial [Ectocarpus sp. 12 AP-2014]